MTIWLHILFWGAIAGVGYIYVGYPLAIALFARLLPGKVASGGEVAAFSMVIVGHNEANNLPQKIDSVLQGEAAKCLVDLHIASDGSDDNTGAVINAMGDTRLRHHDFAERRGKAAVLNELVPRCEADIVVLSDARQRLSVDALIKIVRRFNDPEVGVVSGELILADGDDVSAAGKGMGAYWRYEKFIRQQEGAFRSVPGATGALYAIRRDLYRAIPENSLLDDVAIPMRIVLQGYRCVFESGAFAFDTPSETAQQESVRKRRTIAGNVQVVQHCPAILSPIKNPIWMQYMSHKLARLVSPFLLLAALLSSFLLKADLMYKGFFLLQCGGYAVALIAFLLQRIGVKTGLLGIPLMFTSLNVTTLLAWGDILTGRYNVTWDRSDKS